MQLLILAEVGVHLEVPARSLGGHGGFEVVGVPAGVEEALTARDVVGPEIDLPNPAGPNAVRTLLATSPRIKVIALAVSSSEPYLISPSEAGGSGSVFREGPLHDSVISSAIASTKSGPAAPECQPPLEQMENALTERELEVLGLIEEGLSNKEIAKALCIELATVKNHVHSVLGKLNVCRRTAATARARRLGLLEPDEPEAQPEN